MVVHSFTCAQKNSAQLKRAQLYCALLNATLSKAVRAEKIKTRAYSRRYTFFCIIRGVNAYSNIDIDQVPSITPDAPRAHVLYRIVQRRESEKKED